MLLNSRIANNCNMLHNAKCYFKWQDVHRMGSEPWFGFCLNLKGSLLRLYQLWPSALVDCFVHANTIFKCTYSILTMIYCICFYLVCLYILQYESLKPEVWSLSPRVIVKGQRSWVYNSFIVFIGFAWNISHGTQWKTCGAYMCCSSDLTVKWVTVV